MTDLATVPRGDVALPAVTGGDMRGALDLMRDHVQTLDLVERFVSSIVDTPFIPDSHWPLPVGVRASEMPNRNPRLRHGSETEENWRIRRSIAIASGTGSVLTGLPLGLDPLTALSQVFIVKGRPGLYTKLKLAKAQAHGHKVWDEEYTDEAVTVAGRRRGEDDVVRIRITIEQARKAKWTDNEAYEKTPADMLWSRATSRVLDRIAGDVLFGLPSIEDLEDAPEPADRDRPGTVTATVREGVPAPSDSSDTLRALVDSTVRREAEASVALDRDQTHVFPDEPRPPLPGETVVAPDGRDEPAQPIDEAQWRKINARFVQLGGRVNGPGQQAARLYVIGRIVDRVIEKGSDLTVAEGDLVLSTLQGTTRERLDGLLDERNRVEPGNLGAVIRGQEPGVEPGPPLPGEDDDEPRAATQDDVRAEADELTGDAELDPANDPDDYREGRPAALDGTPDTWGVNP